MEKERAWILANRKHRLIRWTGMGPTGEPPGQVKDFRVFHQQPLTTCLTFVNGSGEGWRKINFVQETLCLLVSKNSY